MPKQTSFSIAWLLSLVLFCFAMAFTPAGAAQQYHPAAPGAQKAYKFGLAGTPMGEGPRLGAFLKDVPPGEIFPGADRYGQPDGKPTVADVYAGDKRLGYVFLTTDIVNTRGYSGKPIDLLISIANDGEIMGAKLVQHHEPIVLIGIPETKVQHFIDGYIGKNYAVNPPKPGDPPPVDIVSGATVTLMVVGDSITRSTLAVAKGYGLGRFAQLAKQSSSEKRSINMQLDEHQSWDELLASGALAQLKLTVADINKAFANNPKTDAANYPEPGDPDDIFIDLYMAMVSVPSIGRSILGDTEYEYLQKRLKPGQQAIVVAGNGTYSFKGSGYVRGGIFDRVEVVQEEDSFHFTDLDHSRLADLARGLPRFKEIALFTVPTDAKFDAVEPWRLQLLVQRVLNVKEKAFTIFSLNYDLPQQYVNIEQVAAPQPATADAGQATTDGAQPNALDDDDFAAMIDDFDEGMALWQQIWQGKTTQIVIISIALALIILVFFFQNQLVKYETFYKRFRIAYLLFTLFWIGWYTQAQLSVVNVLTFTTALRTGFSWEYFLMDPVVFILWIATAMSLIFWNRGAFCGWLCPFGALQELTNQLARKLHVPQIKVSHGVNTRLAGLKYIIFLVLFGISLYDLALAEHFAEVEPFKTAIILKFMREWPFVTFAVALVVIGLFIERFYCRYLCPLGAALAIPARLRIFDWLRRYKTCGNPCQLCAVECPVQAINPEGDINPNECIQCLNCQQLYHNDKRCPHLIQKNARLKRNKPAPVDAGISGEVKLSRKPGVKPRTEVQTEAG